MKKLHEDIVYQCWSGRNQVTWLSHCKHQLDISTTVNNHDNYILYSVCSRRTKSTWCLLRLLKTSKSSTGQGTCQRVLSKTLARLREETKTNRCWTEIMLERIRIKPITRQGRRRDRNLKKNAHGNVSGEEKGRQRQEVAFTTAPGFKLIKIQAVVFLRIQHDK